MTTLARSLALLALALPPALAAQAATGASVSVALTGDAVITRPWSTETDPAFQRLITLIRSQDIAFTNLEVTVHNYESPPMVESGGIHLRAEPAIVKELAWAGFRLASFANNHTMDWGAEGMRTTLRHAREAGLVVAGAGESLREARSAQYAETAKGRVALVATASTFGTEARAGNSLGDMPSRPGLSPLRFTTTNVLAPAAWSALGTVARELGQPASAPDRITVFGQSFVPGERSERRSAPHAGDLAELAAAVRSGRGLSDLLIVSIHAHEAGATLDVPAQFLEAFAHAMIDAGADAVVGHGPHVLRGIELYKGKPIFYSLGDLLLENETVDRLPLEDYERIGADPAGGVAGLNDIRYDNDRRGFPTQPKVWESVVAIPRWQNGVLASLELHPISLGFGQPRTRRGRPSLASEPLGRKIIEDLTRLSAAFGTRIEYRNGVGHVILGR